MGFLAKIPLFISSAKPSLKSPPLRLVGQLTIYHLVALELFSDFSKSLLWTFENLPAGSEGDGLA
jgi:hypothetical protein